MDFLFEHINGYLRLSNEAKEVLHDGFTQVVLKKNDFLLREGNTCRHLYFVQQGALRGYYNAEGREITHWFAFENDFVTSFHSFITHEPSVENMQMLEGSMLWSISRERLMQLFETHREIETLVRIAYEKYYIRLENRFVNGHFRSASERYEKLLQERPGITERIPLGYIASYLGVTQETLSRIRARV